MAAQLNFGTGDSVGFGTTGTGGSGSAAFAKSALSNMAVGDLIVAWIHNQSSAAGGSITAVPSGWTRYGAPIGSASMNASRLSGIYYYPIRTTADITAMSTNPTWTFSDSATRVACVVARATGIDLDSIEDSASTAFANGTAGASFSVPGITTVNATTLLVGGVYHQNSASTVSPTVTSFMTAFQEYKTSPSGSANANTGSALGYTYLTTAGATGAVNVTLDSAGTTSSGELVAFKAGPWTNATPIVRPTIIGTPTTAVAQIATTSFTINVPTGTRDGDLLVMALSAQTSTATADFASSGWNRISQSFEPSNTSDRVIAFYARPVPTATALTQTSFTFTSTDSDTGGRIAAEMFIVRGANLTQVTTAMSPYGNSTSATVSVQPGSTTLANNLLLAAYGGQFTSGLDASVGTGPSGMTQQTLVLSTSNTTVTRTALAVYRQDTDTGTPALKTLTWNSTPTQSAGVSISIRGAAAASTNYGKPLKYTSATNTLSDGTLFYTSATGVLSTPLEIRPVPKGYATVAAMLAASPFYVAHRGGSVNWPEMSLYAYTQSAFWGVGALELSLARSSDGVWFGLHDASLDRTTLNTGGGSGTTLIPSALTWAQIQTYAINYPTSISNPASLPQPYVRWEDIMKAYYGTHVIFVDPKVASAYTTELLNMMDAMPNSPTTHFVGKYYGVSGNAANTSGWAKDLADRGYSRWGYFYQADVPNLGTYQGRWDILGMDYNADSASWTAVKSYGKPVIGHIVPSSTAANTALSYGANGLMVSGVQQIIPRSA